MNIIESKNNFTRQGFSTLLIVVIIGTIVTGLIIYFGASGLWSVKGSIDDKNSMQADQVASACAELALEALRENNNFTGSGSATILNSNCDYGVTNLGGNNRQIQATGSVNGMVRKIKITTNSFNPITVLSWQNVGDF